MANNQTKARDLKGINIYHDNHHGTVMYDFLTGNGYIITNPVVKKLVLNDAGLPIAILLYLVCTGLDVSPVVSLALGAAAYVLCKILFRVLVLYKQPEVKHYKRPEHSGLIDRFATVYNKTQLILVAVMSLAITVVTVIYIIGEKLTGWYLYAMIAMGVAGLALAAVSFIASKKQPAPAKKKK
ncbi:MAG: hypothetical protein HUJ58_06700 [Erysipelotrichaceae bacterium]|nr:hypothetical protein [Erysipelotrichaceae bacterium]